MRVPDSWDAPTQDRQKAQGVMNGICYAVLVLALTLAAGGCGRAPQAATGEPRAAGQLAARVNGAEITLEPSGAEARAGDPRQALEKIIDRELLVQKALQAGLDREPRVKRAIESAQRQVLAQAYLERTAASTVKSTPEEITDFYAQNPALFAQRRIYRLREMTVAAASDKLDLVKSEVATAKNLDEAADWLKWRNFRVSAVTGATQPAEQLPLAYLPQLMRLKEGEIAVFSTALGASVVQLVHAREAPLSEDQAAPLIEQFLIGRKRLALAAAEVKRLRGAASIEYMGDFQRQQD
jgi:EpsD family peptidyl-prolyl cis-trans isomerase